jgi:hypothetical protein
LLARGAIRVHAGRRGEEIVKIAVCTPYYAHVHSNYAYCLAKMLMHTVQARITFNDAVVTPEVEIFMKSSSTLPALRNELVQDALEWGANYLLWADADHNFPPEALLRLLSLNLPVVGVNYPRRTFPTYPTAVALNGEELVWTTEERANNGEITEVSSLGLGLCLMDMTVFHTLHEHALAQGRENFWPLFAFEIVPGQMQGVGEDLYFFTRLREAGVSLYLDHALSWRIGHSREQMITNADAIAEREAFTARHGRSFGDA